VADFSGRDVAWLERRRAELFTLISQAGDFRRGSLNAVWRKCGKPNCACAQPGHRGHGPQWNLTRPGRSGPGRRRSRREGKKGLAARIEEIAAAEVGRLAGLAAGMRGGSLGVGVLEQAMRAALATAGAAARAPGTAAAGRPCMRAVARRRSPPAWGQRRAVPGPSSGPPRPPARAASMSASSPVCVQRSR
jgi:Family of unknown function (DUF6788)